MIEKENFSLATITTFGVGGQADKLIEVSSAEELVKAVKLVDDFLLIAGGSNVFFSDGRIKKPVIRYNCPQSAKYFSIKGNVVSVEAGLKLDFFIGQMIKHGLVGLGKLSGIPGTLGGAVCGNAGAYGATISDHLVLVEVFNGRQIKKINKKNCRFGYRHSIFKNKNWVILKIVFRFKKGDWRELFNYRRRLKKIRAQKYPSSLKIPGSFFKNVLISTVSKSNLAKIDKTEIIDGKIPAGYLLESVGAKGFKYGQLKVADFHANVVVNSGQGSCHQVLQLSKLLSAKVKRRFGIQLEPEVRFLK